MLLVSLLGLVGTPPTAVFVGKLVIIAAAWDGGVAWLAVAVGLNTLASLFHYLRWIAPAYRSGENGTRTGIFLAPRPWAANAAIVAAVASLALGLAAGGLWALADTTLVREPSTATVRRRAIRGRRRWWGLRQTVDTVQTSAGP